MQDSGCLWIGWYFSVFSLDLLHPHFLGVLKSRLLGHISAQNRRAAAWNLRFQIFLGDSSTHEIWGTLAIETAIRNAVSGCFGAGEWQAGDEMEVRTLKAGEGACE